MARRPQPPEPIQPDSVVVGKFAGIRNTVTRERLGPEDLARADDVDLDDAGQMRRRRGQTLVGSGSHHSLFQSKLRVLVVRNGDLGYLDFSYGFHTLVAGVGINPLAYVQVADDVYFSSLTASGIIRGDLTVGPWGQIGGGGTWLSPVITPTDTLQPIGGRILAPPPMATALTAYNGRIYLAAGRVLWATELYLYGLVDRTRTYWYYEDDITMLGAVDDGIYVGTTQGVFFQSGSSIREMKRSPAAVHGALPGSMVVVPRGMIGQDLVAGAGVEQQDVVMFMTTQGVCIGLNGGVVRNLTVERVVFPDAVSVAAMYRHQDGIGQYVAVMDSNGTPSSTARIGDFVDAELIRHSGG